MDVARVAVGGNSTQRRLTDSERSRVELAAVWKAPANQSLSLSWTLRRRWLVLATLMCLKIPGVRGFDFTSGSVTSRRADADIAAVSVDRKELEAAIKRLDAPAPPYMYLSRTFFCGHGCIGVDSFE
jgi:hypothetical protein